MAKVVVELDTVSKDMTVTVDGKALANVRDFYAYFNPEYDAEDYGRMTFSCTMYEENKESNLMTVTRVCAKESEEAKNAAKAGEYIGQGPIPGFVALEGQSFYAEDLAKVFSRRK